MFPKQIQCLEDFEKLPQTREMKKDLLVHVTEEVIHLFGKETNCLDIHAALAREGYSFFAALLLLSGTQLLKVSFLSTKARKMINDLNERIKSRSEDLDMSEKKLNIIIDELDEVLLEQQFKVDSTYFKNYFNKLTTVRM